MKVCGVIAEYDPFHRGHERHLRLTRENTGADFILCVMSGFYTQRGMPALLPPDVRAHMALLSGADAVVQLPAAFSAREGDVFARAGMEILHRLGCVDFLSFGCETDDLPLLQRAAALLEQKPESMEADVQAGLSNGLSYAAAQGNALKNALGTDADQLQLPNAALALGYLRALMRLESGIQPVPVLREHDYHAGEVEAYPSATAVRSALLRGDWQGVEQAIPKQALPVLMQAVQDGRMCRPEGMDSLLRHALVLLGEEGIRKLPGVDEGMESRILSAARQHTTASAILDAVKTRRYTRGRIARALCWAVLGTTKAALPRQITGVQVLGFRESARPLLKRMREGSLPLIMKKAREECLAMENKYADIWQLMAGRDMGEHYRHGPVIIREE